MSALPPSGKPRDQAQASGKRRLLKQQVPGRLKAKPIRNGLISLGILFGMLFFAYSQGSIPLIPKGGEVVKAEFASSANVTPGKTPVRFRGVDVGEVEKVERREDGNGVVVTMRLKDDLEEFDLKRDARADIYWRTVLGFAFFVQLEPGNEAEGLGDATIPMDRTTTQVELDQVLASVDAPSRKGIQTLFGEFEKGFDGESEAGRSIDALAPAMRQVAPGVAALRGIESGDLTQTVRDASRFMGALGRSEEALGQVVSNASTTLGVTAARRADLGSTLRDAPQTLDDTTATMRRVRSTLDVLDPVAQDLRPGARILDDASRDVRPALDELRPTLADARPLLRDLRPALRSLKGAADSGVPFLNELDAPLDRANKTILSGLAEKDRETEIPTYSLIGPVFGVVSNSAALYDVNGHVQRFNALAAGTGSGASFPCNVDIRKLKVNCDDVSKVINTFLGMPPGKPSPPTNAGGTPPIQQPKSAKTAAPDAPRDLTQSVTKTLKDLL